MWVADIEGVTSTGVVHVMTAIALNQSVVRLVVNASERDGGAHVVALGGVVVDHIQNYFEARFVVAAHQAFELGHGATGVLVGSVIVVGRKEAERVVAPVVAHS